MDKVIAKVFETEDYSQFHKLEDNRDVLEGRLKKLMASFSIKSILNPIIVNKNMEIVDGQGRYEARKALGLPIQYIIDPDTTIEDCKLMNRYNTSWVALDFAKSYASGGNQNYVNLLRCCQLTQIPITTALRLANRARQNHGAKTFEEGALTFTTEDVEKVVKTVRAAREIKDALCYSSKLNAVFFTAVSVMIFYPGYDHERMIANCSNCRGDFVQAAKIDGMLKEFERIFNYRRPVGNRVYFSDYMRNRGENANSYQNMHTFYKEENVETLRRAK